MLKQITKLLNQTKSIKYVSIKIDENLTWIDHINDIAIKLKRVNTI